MDLQPAVMLHNLTSALKNILNERWRKQIYNTDITQI